MKYFLIGIVFFSMLNFAYAADTPLIDPEMKKVEEGIQEKRKECDKIFNIGKMMKCKTKFSKIARKEGKFRGSYLYCEKHYINLQFKELDGLWKKLKELQKTARYSGEALGDNDRQLGEVSKEDLETEIHWIESRLARIQRKRTDQVEKTLQYK